MKKSRIFILGVIIAVFALTALLTACDGNVNVFGTSKYTVEVETQVKGIPNNIEITEEYVKSIISVHLKWNDGATTPVGFDNCELSFDKNFLGTKLNVKVKFDKKTGKLSIPIVEPSELVEEEEEEPTITTSIYGMATPDMAENTDKFKSVLEVYVNFPTDEEEMERVKLSADEYEVIMSQISEDGKELEYRLYATEYDIYSNDGEAYTLYDNTRLEYTGEDAIERGMTEDEVRTALSESVKLFYIKDDETRQEIPYDPNNADVVIEDDGATITLNAEDYEQYGFAMLYVSYRKYEGITIDFDWSKWKKDMTDDDIIAGLHVYDRDDFVFNYTTTVERLGNGLVNISMDDEVLCWYLYVAYDAEENPFGSAE